MPDEIPPGRVAELFREAGLALSAGRSPFGPGLEEVERHYLASSLSLACDLLGRLKLGPRSLLLWFNDDPILLAFLRERARSPEILRRLADLCDEALGPVVDAADATDDRRIVAP